MSVTISKDYLAVGISLVALLISLFGLWNSLQSRKISQASGRASVTISTATIKEVSIGAVQIELVVENVGNSLARNLEFEYRTMRLPEPAWQVKYPQNPMDELIKDPLPDLPPRTQHRETLILELPPEKLSDTWPTLVGFLGKLSFVDEATESQFSSWASFTGYINGTGAITKDMFSGTLPPPYTLSSPPPPVKAKRK